MPKKIETSWPGFCAFRTHKYDAEKYWKAYLAWKKEQGFYSSVSVSRFIRSCIEEHIKNQEGKKGGKP
jgi:hypothetical protein